MRRILVAYDGSAAAGRALEHACDYARSDDRVTVVNVMPEPGVSAQLVGPVEERGRQQLRLQEAREQMARRGIEAETAAPVGDPATEILAIADQLEADAIVVARHRAKIPHLLGSISGRIVRGARCDVLVVYAGDID